MTAKSKKTALAKQKIDFTRGRGSSDEKQKAIEGAMQQIEKQFGKGSIMKLGDDKISHEIGFIPTGALDLDFALGIGGLPRGRVVEIYGPEASGKTTLCLSAIANAQKAGGTAAFVDAEHALDPIFAAKLGVQIDDLLVAQPDSGEEALEITEALIRSNAVDIIVIDSVAALVPRSELDGSMGDPQMGLHARLMSQALRKLTGVIAKTNTTLIFINQIRYKIGVMFGSPETTTGGNALKFYASVRLDIRKIEILKKGDEAYGTRVRVKVVKNKTAPPFRKSEFDILFDSGISREGCILDLGAKNGLIERSGTWYSYQSTRIGQGRDNARNFLQQNPDITDEIETELRRQHADKLKVNNASSKNENSNKLEEESDQKGRGKQRDAGKQKKANAGEEATGVLVDYETGEVIESRVV